MKQQRERARADARAKRTGSVDVAGLPAAARRARPHRLAGLRHPAHRLARARRGRRADEDGAGGWPGRARSPGSCWTARPSTPSPAARSPTPASSPGTAAAPRSSTSSGRSRAWSPTRCGCSRASCATGAELTAEVDHEWRLSACQAHSGTHVVHAALRQVLGPQALQSGSYNRPGYLRLDFAWQGALSPQQRTDIEDVANAAVRADHRVTRVLHDPARGAGLRGAGAVRRDLRRAGAGRRDRRPVVARALRWHPRARQRADRHAGPDRRVLGRLRRPPGRGGRRPRGLPLPGPRARPGPPARRAAEDPAGRPRRAGQRHAGPAARRGQGARRAARAAVGRRGRPAGRRRHRRRRRRGGHRVAGRAWAVATCAPSPSTSAADSPTGRPWCCWRRSPVARWHSWPR